MTFSDPVHGPVLQVKCAQCGDPTQGERVGQRGNAAIISIRNPETNMPHFNTSRKKTS